MSDLLEFLVHIMFETVFGFGDKETGRRLGQFIGCLGGSVIYAMTAKQVDLENDDWRSVIVGLLVIAAAIAFGGILLVTTLRWALY